jgi:NADH dehydrogenase [ubiquinone] 1 alpha subcomplex assembly factor 5
MGGTTLPELRASLVMAELEREGGVSPHVGPFVELSDVGSLMQRAGFSLPTLDVDTFRVAFPNAAVLMEHVQRMGESNASVRRRPRTSLNTFLAASCIYQGQFALPQDEYNDNNNARNNEVEASVQVIYAIGWTPHESQPQPLPRGSATHKMGDLSAVKDKPL